MKKCKNDSSKEFKEEKMVTIFKCTELESDKLSQFIQLGRVLSGYRNMPMYFYANTSSGVHTGFIMQLHGSIDECISHFKDQNSMYNGKEYINSIYDPLQDYVIENLSEQIEELFTYIKDKGLEEYKVFKLID